MPYRLPAFPRTLCTLLVLLAASACSSGTGCPTESPVAGSVSINGHGLRVEIAATPLARTCGLSLRESLPVNHGMLFIERNERVLEFWMKNTTIPLDIAYLDNGGRILEIHQMDPGEPERRYSSGIPARYALETHQGWFHSKGIQIGHTAVLRLPADLEIR